VGIYAINPTHATGGSFDINNYQVQYLAGNLTIAPRPVTLLGGKPSNGKASLDTSSPGHTLIVTNALAESPVMVQGQVGLASIMSGKVVMTDFSKLQLSNLNYTVVNAEGMATVADNNTIAHAVQSQFARPVQSSTQSPSGGLVKIQGDRGGVDFSSQGVSIQLVKAASDQTAGISAISVPQGASLAGGIIIPLSQEIKDSSTLLASMKVTLANEQPLPSWIKYNSKDQSFALSAVPPHSFPLQLLMRSDAQRYLIQISESMFTKVNDIDTRLPVPPSEIQTQVDMQLSTVEKPQPEPLNTLPKVDLPQVAVEVTRTPNQPSGLGILSIRIPGSSAWVADKITIPLAPEIAMAQAGKVAVQLSLPGHAKLPAWLRFNAQDQTLQIKRTADLTFPIQLVMTLGDKRYVMMIEDIQTSP
jgi:hypothetical protein